MRGKGSRRAIPAPESILPKTARPRGSGQITNAIPLMVHTESNCYYLPPKAVAALAKGLISKLKPVLTLEEVATSFTVLDFFDQSLRHSGRFLLETGATFELLMSDGRALSQSAKRLGQFVTDFQKGPVKQALADLSPLRSLSAIGSGTLRHGTLALLDDDQKTHCRAYVHILTGTKGDGVALITLQGLRGYDRSLTELRKHIKLCRGAVVSDVRLYQGIFFEQNAPDAKPDGMVKPDETAFDAATDIILASIPVVRANEGGIMADQGIEFLHQYRVALRKIRSVLSLFKGVYERDQTADLKARFSDLMAPTGRLRDLDVYLLQRQKYYELLPKTLHGGLGTMFRIFDQERTVESANLTRHLASKTYVNEMSNLARLFAKRKKLQHGPSADLKAHDFACDLIWERYQKICKIAGGISPETDDAEVHTLRIHFKKLRYLMEFFGPFFPKSDFKALLKPMKHLQDNLGLYNDYSVQQVSLQNFLRGGSNRPDGVDLEVAQSVGALTAALHCRQLDERVKVVENFAQFNSLVTQKTFRGLFHERKDKK